MNTKHDSTTAVQELCEAPETPAPLFALRAFRTALFGTPKRVEEEKKHLFTANTMAKPKEVEKEKSQASKAVHRRSGAISPQRGILLTPGTSNNRRKSVTWNTNHQKLGSSPASSLGEGQSSVRRTLFSTSATQTTAPAEVAATANNPMSAGDITMDLNQPRSVSGRHWKMEYERDHDRSKQELKNLIQANLKIRDEMGQITKEKDELRVEVGEVRKEASIAKQEIIVLEAELKHAEIQSITTSAAEKPGTCDVSEHDRLSIDLAKAKDRISSLERENKSMQEAILRLMQDARQTDMRRQAKADAYKRREDRHIQERQVLKEQIAALRAQQGMPKAGIKAISNGRISDKPAKRVTEARTKSKPEVIALKEIQPKVPKRADLHSDKTLDRLAAILDSPRRTDNERRRLSASPGKENHRAKRQHQEEFIETDPLEESILAAEPSDLSPERIAAAKHRLLQKSAR